LTVRPARKLPAPNKRQSKKLLCCFAVDTNSRGAIMDKDIDASKGIGYMQPYPNYVCKKETNV